jgi:hypothetical protein
MGILSRRFVALHVSRHTGGLKRKTRRQKTMSKHTPGPWKVDVWNYDNADMPRKDLVVLNHSFRLATIDWDEGKDNPYTIAKNEAESNARLIAAAPEMYEALKTAKDDINALLDDKVCDAPAMIRWINAILAKIEEV